MKRKRDSLGRFAKSVEANDNIIITLPHLKTVIVYLILLFILIPWLYPIYKYNIINLIIKFINPTNLI